MNEIKQNIFLKLKDFWVLLLLGFLSFSCYYQILHTNFVSDDFTFLYECKTIGLSLFSENFNDPFFLPFTRWFQYTEFLFFGLNSTGYHIVAILIHTCNAWVIYLIMYNIYKPLLISKEASLIISLLFLICPYQTEAVVWFSSISYLLATLFFLLSMLFFINSKFALKKTNFTLSLLFYLCSLLSKEIAIVVPIILIAYQLIFDKSLIIKLKITSFFIGITILYLLLRYLALGTFIGGYGISTHLNFNINLITQNTIAYFAKFISGYRYLPEFLLNILRLIYHSNILITVFTTIIIGFILFVIKKKEISYYKIKIISFLFISFFISLFPIINLETSFLGDVQSDRYGYLPSVLFYIFLVSTTKLFFNVTINKVVYCSLILYFIYNLIQTNKQWQMAGNITTNIIYKFKNIQFPLDCYVLNMPDNYNGVYVFRTSFSEAIKLYYPNISEKNIHIFSWQNITSNNDVIKLKDSNDSIFINILGDKNYLMRYNKDLVNNISSIDFISFNKKGFSFKKKNISIPQRQFYIFNKGTLQNCDSLLFNQ